MPLAGTVKALGAGTYKLFFGTATGPSSYTTGGFTVTVSDLTEVHDAIVVAGGGYLAEVASISGNSVTIKVYEFNYPATAAGTATEVSAGTDLSGVTFRIVALGE